MKKALFEEHSIMKIPRFELTRVYEDGTREPPQIVPVTQLPWDTRTDRRGFLGAALMAGTALAAVSSSAGTAKNTGKGAETPSDSCQDSRAHKEIVYRLVISPDGKILVSGELGQDHQIMESAGR
jgi:hypothetical protein